MTLAGSITAANGGIELGGQVEGPDEVLLTLPMLIPYQCPHWSRGNDLAPVTIDSQIVIAAGHTVDVSWHWTGDHKDVAGSVSAWTTVRSGDAALKPHLPQAYQGVLNTADRLPMFANTITRYDPDFAANDTDELLAFMNSSIHELDFDEPEPQRDADFELFATGSAYRIYNKHASLSAYLLMVLACDNMNVMSYKMQSFSTPAWGSF